MRWKWKLWQLKIMLLGFIAIHFFVCASIIFIMPDNFFQFLIDCGFMRFFIIIIMLLLFMTVARIAYISLFETKKLSTDATHDKGRL